MIRISSPSARKSSSRAEDLQIQRHRHILIVILVVCLVSHLNIPVGIQSFLLYSISGIFCRYVSECDLWIGN